jgi:hypothetical protein
MIESKVAKLKAGNMILTRSNWVLIITSLPFTVKDLEDFFPNKTVLIHFAGDFLPIAAG